MTSAILRGSLFLSATLLVALTAGANAKASGSAGQRTCSPELLERTCKDLSKRPVDLRNGNSRADGVVFNYFLVGDRTRADEIAKLNRPATSDLNARAMIISKKVQAAAVEFVTAGKPDSQLSSEVLAVATRLRTIQFHLAAAHDSECYASGDPGIPNAAYNSVQHTVSICPSQVRTTSQEIAATIAHEIGHAVSPCAMSSSLIKFNAPSTSAGSCLLKIGEASQRSNEDREIWGDEDISIAQLPEPGYGVDRFPQRNTELIRCGLAERVEKAESKAPSIYSDFNACTAIKGPADYDNWISKRLFNVDPKPDFKKVPGKFGEIWARQFADYKREQPYDSCFVKDDERFADSFGAIVLSKWGETKNMSPSQFRDGIQFLTDVKCAQKIIPGRFNSEETHPPIDERIASFLKPRATGQLLKCQPSPNDYCGINENTFSNVPDGKISEPSRGTPVTK